MAKTVRLFDKKGMVIAPDSKFTGEELTWDGWEKWSTEEFFAKRRRALWFYSYYVDFNGSLKMLTQWMKSTNEYSRAQIKKIEDASQTDIFSVYGKMARMLYLGMPATHPNAEKHCTANKLSYDIVGQDIEKFVHDGVTDALSQIVTVTSVAKKKVEPQGSSQGRHRDKLNAEVISHVEAMIDSWAETDPPKIKNLSITGLLQNARAQAGAKQYLISRVKHHRDMFYDAYNRKCEQAAEGLSYLSRPNLRKGLAALDNTLAGIEEYFAKSKKPTKKIPPEKLVKNFKYCEKDSTFGKSVSPVGIIGASCAILYNTKYKRLSLVYALDSDGLTVSGSGIRSFSDKSVAYTLRKPEEFLKEFATLKSPAQIDKAINSLTTKPKTTNGRSNGDTLIMKILK